MIIAPYDKAREFDIYYERVIKELIIPAIQAEQDWIQLNVGPTGTGKTSLTLHGYGVYDPAGQSIEYVALNRPDYAIAMQGASTKTGLRFVCWDEADVNKRDALSAFNKDTLSMNWAVRGLSIWQVWNNPSAEWLDRPFVEEKISSVIFVLDKWKDKPRRYLFFTRKGILKLLSDKQNLKYETIKRYGKEYALYMGWFKEYKGVLWQDYMKKKQERMTNKVGEFYEKYGKGKNITASKAAETIGARKATVLEAATLALDQGLIRKEARRDDGKWQLDVAEVAVIKNVVEKLRQREPREPLELDQIYYTHKGRPTP